MDKKNRMILNVLDVERLKEQDFMLVLNSGRYIKIELIPIFHLKML